MVGGWGQVRRDDGCPAALQPAGIDRANHDDEDDESGDEEGKEGIAARVRVVVPAVVISALELVVEACQQRLELCAEITISGGSR